MQTMLVIKDAMDDRALLFDRFSIKGMQSKISENKAKLKPKFKQLFSVSKARKVQRCISIDKM